MAFIMACLVLLEVPKLNNEEKMPKMKTNSSAKKRFSFTASGKVRATQAGKQHGMRKRSASQIREQRGTTILCDADAKIAIQFMPYGKKFK
jgi:large subunit ribosomal protein L35